MKAAVFKGLGLPLSIDNVDDPTPEGGQVVVQVGRCGICGSDLHATEEPTHLAPVGKVLGHEWAGEIVAVGKEVERVKVGDKVAVLPLSGCGHCAACLSGEPAWCDHRQIDGGGYAEYALTHERQCVVLPSTLSMADGALVEPLAVGLHGVVMADMKPGQKILVIGAGPIGLAAIFWARRMGAGTIAVSASSTRRAALADEMGASFFIPPSDDPVATAVEALGGPPDIVFECVGKPGLIDQAVRTVRRRGTVVVLGLCWSPDTMIPGVAVGKEVRIQCAGFYSMQEFQHSAEPLDKGDVAPRSMITDTVSLLDMPPAFEALRERTTQCKVLVSPFGN